VQRNVLTTALATLALLAPLPLLGIAGAQGQPPTPVAAAARGAAPTELAGYPRPTVTGEDFVEGVRVHAEETPLRLTGTLLQQRATDLLAEEAGELGLDVTRRTYRGGLLSAVVATKQGTDRADEVIVFGAHLDTMVGTIEGAYDNGTGVRTVMELARAFAQVSTHRTLEFHFYNGEEEGALTSTEVAAEYAAEGRSVSAYLGFDMVGIGWPVGGTLSNKNCLCMWRGASDEALDEVLREVNYDFLGFPEDKQLVSIEGVNRRNSDEASWADKGYRTLRWAGLRRAADYPQYHLPQDNLATIDAVAGGREFFEKGLVNTLTSAYYTAAALDLEGVETPAPLPVPDSAKTPEHLKDHGTRKHTPTPN
jgi:hypothetical protein